MPPAPRPIADRFWSKVAKSEDTNGCWRWTGATGQGGYGRLWDNGVGEKVQASRVSWVLHRGPIPNGLQVLHRCDNPPCCNPDHLFLGTVADNVADCTSKGRNTLIANPQLQPRGDSHWTRRDPVRAKELIGKRRREEWASGRRSAIRDPKGRIVGTRMSA